MKKISFILAGLILAASSITSTQSVCPPPAVEQSVTYDICGTHYCAGGGGFMYCGFFESQAEWREWLADIEAIQC